jgi:hypothetical protein
MSDINIREHSVTTGEIVDRKMTDEEFAQYKIDQANVIARKTAEAEKATAKAALLERLGITQEEANLLLG